jgi:signal transduction histidine kinase
MENAVYHTPPKTVVTVAVSMNGTVEITDHGPEIASEDRERIFERLARAIGQNTGRGSGSCDCGRDRSRPWRHH